VLKLEFANTDLWLRLGIAQMNWRCYRLAHESQLQNYGDYGL
jgi:hypothetical protein